MSVAAWSKTEGGKVKSVMLMSEVSNRRLKGFKEGGRVRGGASEGVAF